MSQLTQSIDEVEQLRQQYIDEAKEGLAADWDDASKAGSLGCHELLDRTSLLMNNLDEYVLAHPACLRNKEWFALAHQAVDALNQLYQKVGAEHIEDRDE